MTRALLAFLVVLGFSWANAQLGIALPGPSFDMKTYAIIPSKQHMVVSPAFREYSHHSLLGPNPVDSFSMFPPAERFEEAVERLAGVGAGEARLQLPAGGDQERVEETEEAFRVRVEPLGTGNFQAVFKTDNVLIIKERVGVHEVTSRFELPANAQVDRSRVTAESLDDGSLVITLPKINEEAVAEGGVKAAPRSISDNLRKAFGSGSRSSGKAATASNAGKKALPSPAGKAKAKAKASANVKAGAPQAQAQAQGKGTAKGKADGEGSEKARKQKGGAARLPGKGLAR